MGHNILVIIGQRPIYEDNVKKYQLAIEYEGDFANKLIDQSKIQQRENNDDIKRILGFAIEGLNESEKYLAPRKIKFKVGAK